MKTATMTTPTGPFTIVVNADGAVVTSGWTSSAAPLLTRAGLVAQPDSVSHVGDAQDAAMSYFGGDLAAIDRVDVEQTSSAFIERCWGELRRLPPGGAPTYSDLALAAGNERAIRAAANACARNRCGLFVPCHRIRRKDGGLGGFAWGVDVKRWLLEHERCA